MNDKIALENCKPGKEEGASVPTSPFLGGGFYSGLCLPVSEAIHDSMGCRRHLQQSHLATSALRLCVCIGRKKRRQKNLSKITGDTGI